MWQSKEKSTFKLYYSPGDFLLLIPPFLFTVHVRPVLSPYQAGNTCYILSCLFKYIQYSKTICTRNIDIALCLAPLFLFVFGITGFCSTFYQYNIVDTLNIVETLFVIYILNTLYTLLYNNNNSPLILFNYVTLSVPTWLYILSASYLILTKL